MTNCRLVCFEPPCDDHGQSDDLHDKSPKSDDSSMCSTLDSRDDISLLRDLFLNLKTTTRSDWTNINIERRHDFKFWADVTHNFGFDILKCVFNICSSYCDNYNVTKYVIASAFGDELSPTDNYTLTLRNEVAFQLLSGMIENRIPGSLRLVVRANGYTFFENRINQILLSKTANQDALCHNMEALMTLFPYLVECESVNLSQLCFNFVTSKLWKYMWSNVGLGLKTKAGLSNERLFSVFLDLTTVVLYGARGPGFLKRLHTSSTSYLWNCIIPLISWSLEKKILSKMVAFVCDIFLMSVSDGCVDSIPSDVFKVLHHNVSRSIENAKAEGVGKPNGLSSSDFDTYHSSCCFELLQKLIGILTTKSQEYNKNPHPIYELSTLGHSRLTIPPSVENNLSSGKELCEYADVYNFSTTKIFPRVLPCFNFDCPRIYHIDLPQIHVINGESVSFLYCKRCGIPSYCSERCCNEHWQVCHYFVSFPTFAKYFPSADMPIISTLEAVNTGALESQVQNKWNLIF